jgi:hypothetical protein
MTSSADKWDTFKAEFYRDGSLRDIYVFATGPEDWRRLAEHVAVNYPFRFSGAWWGQSFPESLSSLFSSGPESVLTTLSIDVGSLILNCHFFAEDEIELDLDPAEVDTPAKLEVLFGFMRSLARALEKEVFLTPENMREIRIFRTSPLTEHIHHTKFGGFE